MLSVRKVWRTRSTNVVANGFSDTGMVRVTSRLIRSSRFALSVRSKLIVFLWWKLLKDCPLCLLNGEAFGRRNLQYSLVERIAALNDPAGGTTVRIIRLLNFRFHN